MGKIAISSDWHNKPFGQVKFETQRWSTLEWFISSLRSKKEAVDKMIDFLLKNKKIKTLILGGDFQENTSSERGMVEVADVTEMEHVLYFLTQMTKIDVELNAGNNELGYDLPLSSDECAGISEESIANFLKVAKRETLFHAFSIDGKRFILIPYLFSEETNLCWVKQLQDELLVQLQIELHNQEQQVVLIMHDFDSLMNESLACLVGDSYDKGKIKKVFCGHNHARWGFVMNQLLIRLSTNGWLFPLYAVLSPFLMLGGAILHKDWMLFEKIRKYYASKRLVVKMARRLRPVTIPAPDGLFGLGGGLLIYDTQTGEVTKEKI